jgi:hypothetical protein
LEHVLNFPPDARIFARQCAIKGSAGHSLFLMRPMKLTSRAWI